MKVQYFRKYRAGELIPESGFYECGLCSESEERVKLHLKKGNLFPMCSSKNCKDIYEWEWSGEEEF